MITASLITGGLPSIVYKSYPPQALILLLFIGLYGKMAYQVIKIYTPAPPPKA